MTNLRDNIKLELKTKGLTQAEIATMLKVTPVSVHDVITGKRKNPRIRKAIAMAIGKPVADLWPDTTKKQNTPGPAVG